MTIRNLDHLFRPSSVAVIGASAKAHSVGATVLRNLLKGPFTGAVMAVNPKYQTLEGIPVYASVKVLPQAPDLAVICTPPGTVPRLIAELGERGTKAAIVLTAGLSRTEDGRGRTLATAMLDAAKPYLLRIVGPNCVGILVPGIGLNASFAHTHALPGKLAFVSQSGALTTAVLDWATSKGIGFSHFISMGDGADVDFGDVIDYLASDVGTSAILLYIESIRSARKFMSAARAAARNKPVVVVKAGRVAEGARAAASHTGALAGADDVYEAAIRRAGMLRVASTDELFNAVETLARARPEMGENLVIMTNGGGAGVMATDALIQGGGKLASLSEQTVTRLRESLPATASLDNPVDIVGDAPVERYVTALRALMDDPGTGAVLFIHAPTAIVPSIEIATAVLPIVRQSSRNVFTSWLGGDSVEPARRLFHEAGVPTYDTPEQAVRAFLQVVDYRRNQELLMETPPSVPQHFTPDTATAAAVIKAAQAEGRTILNEPESKTILAAYGVPVVEGRIARTADEAAWIATELGLPVALKILSPDITHKSDVGGVSLNLGAVEEVRLAAKMMEQRLRALQPGSRLSGFTVQRMVPLTSGAVELIVGAATDPVFGPVILFGHGGTAVEAIADRAIGLPPLNHNLAKELVSRTRVSRLLDGYRNRPPANREAINMALVQTSQLVCDLPEVREVDINPLLADEHGVVALDARIVIAPGGGTDHDRLAIKPYPQELEETLVWDGAPVLLRPIRPEDEPQYNAFLMALTPQDMHFRFFDTVRQLAHSQLARLTQIDYDREMAFVAIGHDAAGQEHILGTVQAMGDPDNIAAEFAIAVRSGIQGHGLGGILLTKVIDYCRWRGTVELVGEVLTENERMLTLAKALGFRIQHKQAERGVMRVALTL
ncbi:bifunctional acetate--CoA ligase family protein/GNAT family N-acetyltransferase [Crenobacter sp. SG2305]|uniref:bifunctional acetate--CoA ligase family protein/GNAT family N-acetyltransferase n=1 Tax=Crenobacter oryzisoli TaxID=3056844 RepID=UPI0025AA378B|nr:bifunctional acetate--CoA ligase family protein/GNAT family N-acetyltransferase [Crenobacter sp. SG2305]MDN0081959.1 bifunctional acetate--CoA ligase family protein/GNAT family N-acetyltransferase [Crenobacter sp. SG2305]